MFSSIQINLSKMDKKRTQQNVHINYILSFSEGAISESGRDTIGYNSEVSLSDSCAPTRDLTVHLLVVLLQCLLCTFEGNECVLILQKLLIQLINLREIL